MFSGYLQSLAAGAWITVSGASGVEQAISVFANKGAAILRSVRTRGSDPADRTQPERCIPLHFFRLCGRRVEAIGTSRPSVLSNSRRTCVVDLCGGVCADCQACLPPARPRSVWNDYLHPRTVHRLLWNPASDWVCAMASAGLAGATPGDGEGRGIRDRGDGRRGAVSLHASNASRRDGGQQGA